MAQALLGYDAKALDNPPGPMQPRLCCSAAHWGVCGQNPYLAKAEVTVYNIYTWLRSIGVRRTKFPLLMRAVTAGADQTFLFTDFIGKGETVLLVGLEEAGGIYRIAHGCRKQPLCFTGQQKFTAFLDRVVCVDSKAKRDSGSRDPGGLSPGSSCGRGAANGQQFKQNETRLLKTFNTMNN